MKIFRYKLVVALVTLLVIVFIGLGLLIGQLFKSSFVNSMKDQFAKEGSLIVHLIEQQGGIEKVDPLDLKKVHEILQARIIIVDNDRSTVYDSGDSEEHSYYKHDETVEKILADSVSDYSGFYHIGRGFDISYYWQNIIIGNKFNGTLIISSPITEISSVYAGIWTVLFVILGIAFAIIIIIWSKIVTRFTKPVESAAETAIELAKGNYRARTYEDRNNNNEFEMLSTSINILARNLQRITKEQEMQNDRLITLIENMGTGLLLIDDRGYITLINRTYKEMFQIDNKELHGKSYTDVIQEEEILNIIQEVFMTEEKLKRQIKVPLGIHMKYFETYGVPIISNHNEWKGIVVVFHDITEIKNLEQIRKDFVANVSHELKTPITSIRGFAETLLDGAYKDEMALESFLTIILKESERLQSIISDLLELSKIEKHGFSLSIETVNLNDIISHVLEVLGNKAEKKSIKIEFLDEAKTNIIEGDSLRLKQIFMNLITNAISYTPENGHVFIRINETKGNISVEVADTGIGIEQKELPRIFERFYRVDKDRSRNSGGTGLGLAIVKHLIEAHKGTIAVESTVGKGSIFTVKFPKIFKFTND